MAKDVVQMVRGLSMGARFLTLLIEELKKNNGYEEMLHFLTTERGRNNLTQVAELIATLEWRVPKSLVMKLAREASEENYQDPPLEFDTNFYWVPALKGLDIPYLRFTTPEEANEVTHDGDIPIDREIVDQLVGKIAKPGMKVEWRGDQYLLVGLTGGHPADTLEVGDTIKMSHLGGVHLSLLRYFDLEN